MKKHRAAVHDIDVLWWFCDYSGCEYKAKDNSSITKHEANKHNTGVKWRQCTECDFKGKTNDHLRRHNKIMHTSK